MASRRDRTDTPDAPGDAQNPRPAATDASDVASAPRGGGSLSAAERQERALAIALAHDRGATWAEVAREFGLSERQARRIGGQVAAGRIGGRSSCGDPLVLADPFEPVRRALGTLEWASDQLRHEATRDSSAARVGALRSLVAIEGERVRLFVALGQTPSRPSDVMAGERARDTLMRVLAALRANGVEESKLAAAREVLDEAANRAPSFGAANRQEALHAA